MRDVREALPTGTVTFFRSDVEGSMAHARRLGSRWDELNATHLAILRDAVEDHGGVPVRTEGDALFAAFAEAPAAVAAAVGAQRVLTAHPWPDGAVIRVRIGLHTGRAHLSGDDYGGFDVNRAARISAVGHGGQVILSDPTRALATADLPSGVTCRDLGEHRLRGVPVPERVFQLDIEGLPHDFPPLRTGAETAGNLPERLTSFVGREREIAAIGQRLGQARLITITGPGGIGKTSVAVEAARAAAPAFPDGTWFVPLDVVREPEGVLRAIAQALGIQEGPYGQLEQGLESHLRPRTLLLVLDNFEQVVDAGPSVAALVHAAPELRVLVTSRTPLHLSGEHEHSLGRLDGAHGSGADSPAVRLFSDRAAALRPGWSAGSDVGVVEEICALVDGLPLGIELAAARVGHLPLAVIRDRLAQALPLPGAGPRDAPERQRTLGSAIGWSYELLPATQQRRFRELGVFEGGFDVDQARSVVGDTGSSMDVLDDFIELADQSLLETDVMSGGSDLGGLRFRLLRTIQAFARERLEEEGETADVRRRHAEAFLTLAEAAAPHLPGADQVRWLDRLSQDHANLHAAVAWAVENGDATIGLRLIAALWRYWQIGGHLREARSLTDAVIALPAAADVSIERMWGLAAAGGIAYWQADGPRALDLYRQQLETARAMDHRPGEADALYNLTFPLYYAGDADGSRKAREDAAALYEAIGDDRALAHIAWDEANFMITKGDLARARSRLTRLYEDFCAHGDSRYVAMIEDSFSWISLREGDIREALRWGVAGTVSAHAVREVSGVVVSLGAVALCVARVGEAEVAATLLGAFETLCDTMGVRPPAGLELVLGEERPEEQIRELMSEEAFHASFEQGARMTVDDAVALLIEVAERLGVAPALS